MYKTENGGTSWFQPTSFNFGYPILACCFLDSNTGYAVSYEGNIFETRDGGTTWNKQDSGISSTLTSIFFINSSTGYAVGNDGVILKYY